MAEKHANFSVPSSPIAVCLAVRTFRGHTSDPPVSPRGSENTKLKYQLSTSSTQLTESERQCRHLQQRDADLQESLRAKVRATLAARSGC